MSNSYDWLPIKREEKLIMVKKWMESLPLKATRWNIPAALVTELNNSAIETAALFTELNSNSCTKTLVTQCAASFKSMVAKMRFMKRHYFLAPPLLPEEFTELGLKVPSSTRSSIPVLDEVPELKIKPGDFKELVFDFQVHSTGKKSVPYGHNGAVLYWKVGGEVPKSAKEFNNSELHSVSHFSIWFNEEDRGQPAHFAICWENQRGQKGPLSEVKTELVP
ncbi:MAG: hypothetical protein LBS86_07265 [Treponema sp.]|jgi:hypothetical protein|nr:hypothetical protein [Treponema sp.]